MADNNNLRSRRISERWIIRGTLELLTPAHFGGGDFTSMLDMPVLRDAVDGSALLPGTSTAGALRNYLCIRQYGYAQPEPAGSPGEALFGFQHGEIGAQSWLVVNDSFCANPLISTRDGIERDPKTGTVLAQKKFDFETLAQGSVFQLSFELQTQDKNRDELLSALAVALQGLERGEIALGGRKSRGLGKCKVTGWEVIRYELNQRAGLESYLRRDESQKKPGTAIAEIFHQFLGKAFLPENINKIDARKCFEISADFAIKDSLLIRSGGERAKAPDFVHLAWKNPDGSSTPILSGSSLAGALRQRSRRIIQRLSGDLDLIDEIFGHSPVNTNELPTSSRLWVTENALENPASPLVQTRIKLDRFTQSVMTGALFNMEPVFARKGNQTLVKVVMRLLESTGDTNFEARAGLLLHLLRDLWVEDLPLGGEVSIGRGRMKGLKAVITHGDKKWILTSNTDGSLSCDSVSGFDELENYANKLKRYCKQSEQKQVEVIK